jgi:hypothetical protein
VFYLKYDMYRNSWPLLALGTYRKLLATARTKTNGQVNGKEHPNVEAGSVRSYRALRTDELSG